MKNEKFELMVKDNSGRMSVKVYKCATTMARWRAYYLKQGFKVA